MLNLADNLLRRAIHDEDGFTLLEVLVAMLSATIVAGVLFSILAFAGSETTTLTDKIEANQNGRIAMATLDNQLHSSCLEKSFAPIQEASSENLLRFISAYSEGSAVTSASLNEVAWVEEKNLPAGQHMFELRETTWPSTGSAPFLLSSFPREPKTEKITIIGKDLERVGKTSTFQGEPVFQYFKYAEKVTESAEAPLTSLSGTDFEGKASVHELSEKEAKEAASVEITFQADPHDRKSEHNRGADINSQLTFAFSVPDAETPIHDGPCQ